MVSNIDCITDFNSLQIQFHGNKDTPLWYSCHIPIEGLKNHLAIFAPLGNMQANNLTQFVADEDLRSRKVLLLTSFLLRELLHTLTSLCFQDVRCSQHCCRHFM